MPRGASLGQTNSLDVDPRLAFAWAPNAFHGKTVIRSGFGMYHEDGQLDDQNIADKNEYYSYALTNVNYPIAINANGVPVTTTGTVSQTPQSEQRNRKDTYVTQWGLSLQQSLPSNLIGTLSYVGSKGTNLLAESMVNVINPVTLQRPYPTDALTGLAVGQINWRGTVRNSDYEGLSVGVKRPFARGLLMAANYTWSHEIDDDTNGSGDGDSITPQNVSCQPTGASQCGERASGAFDARHVFNANAVYRLPFGPGKTFLNQPGVLRAIFGSWSLSPIVTARTGFPIDITATRTGCNVGQAPTLSNPCVPDGNASGQRPNFTGQPIYLHGILNPAAFCSPGTAGCPGPEAFGDVPRNFGRAPGVWQTDLALSKRIPLTEQASLQFRAEVFNLFNKPLYATPDGTISDSDFGQLSSPLNTTPIGMGTPRQFQFMLKVQF